MEMECIYILCNNYQVKKNHFDYWLYVETGSVQRQNDIMSR